MHNLYVMWLYALRFVSCNVCVNAFIFLYSKIFIAKLSLFVIGAESHWQFISMCSCFVRDWCLSVVERTWLSD